MDSIEPELQQRFADQRKREADEMFFGPLPSWDEQERQRQREQLEQLGQHVSSLGLDLNPGEIENLLQTHFPEHTSVPEVMTWAKSLDAVLKILGAVVQKIDPAMLDALAPYLWEALGPAAPFVAREFAKLEGRERPGG